MPLTDEDPIFIYSIYIDIVDLSRGYIIGVGSGGSLD
jgi:hypothetical protein